MARSSLNTRNVTEAAQAWTLAEGHTLLRVRLQDQPDQPPCQLSGR